MSTFTDESTLGADALVWGERADISARSTLVTILGDAVLPLGGTVWLGHLFTLAAPFGFNERLVRTSMSRLVVEGWVISERVGRRSRYSLTPFGRAEFAEADARIYRAKRSNWEGDWTLVFVAPASEGESELLRHLGWRGFAEMRPGVYARPDADAGGIRQLLDRLDLAAHPPVATARFDRLDLVTDTGSFRASSGLADAEASYRDFVERYRWTISAPLGRLAPEDAFLVRTMLAHDLRRARLRDPDLPAELLPDDWVGAEALSLAEAAYGAVAPASTQWLATVTDVSLDPSTIAHRFAPSPSAPSPSSKDLP